MNEYSCTNCDFKIIDEPEMFYVNSEQNEFEEFFLCMSTANLGENAEIKGHIGRTYCPYCNKLIKIYDISETVYDEEETIKKLEEKLEKTPVDNSLYFYTKEDEIDCLHNKKMNYSRWPIIKFFQKLIHPYEEIKNLNKKQDLKNHFMEQFTTENNILNYIEYNDSFINMIPFEKDPIFPDFIECPQCKRKIYRIIHEDTPCPICGGKIENTMCIDFD